MSDLRGRRSRPTGGRRTAFVIAAVIGVGLVAAPFAFNMFARAQGRGDAVGLQAVHDQ